MEQRLNACRGHHKASWIDAKDTVLAFVPHPVAVDPVPIPGTHSAGGERQAAALLAFQKSRVGFFQLRRARANAIFELGIKSLQLSGLAIKFAERPDLAAQYLGNDRHRNVVPR